MTSNEKNTIFIGAKPPMNYVLAIVTQFNGGAEEVLLKARGRAIARAVDVAEIVRHRFVEDSSVKNIRIGTERLAGERGRTSNVSSIEIVLAKGVADGHVIPSSQTVVHDAEGAAPEDAQVEPPAA